MFKTERLVMRPWREADLAPFAALNSDPYVMEYMRKPLSRVESDEMVAKICDGLDENGFGLWAVEVQGGAPFIGFVGLSIPNFQTHFMPCVEVGWRLAREHWGKGYATEAGRRALKLGFEDFDLDEIVSFTTVGNGRSRAVMERLGLSRDPADDFNHPTLPPDHPIYPHVLYRISKADWKKSAS